MYIATRPARLEAREAGFLVFQNPSADRYRKSALGKAVVGLLK